METGDVQVSMLLCALGKEAKQIFNTFVLLADDDYDTVLGKLNNYFVPKMNVIPKRACFYLRAQKQRIS